MLDRQQGFRTMKSYPVSNQEKMMLAKVRSVQLFPVILGERGAKAAQCCIGKVSSFVTRALCGGKCPARLSSESCSAWSLELPGMRPAK